MTSAGFEDMPPIRDVTGDGTDRHACRSLLQLVQQGLAAIDGDTNIRAGEGRA